ncbi:MAG: MBL fold metallo-hydrolase [Thermoplasmata archaeon]|nr:MBL fold metallo-hydrolase [Thermoplasmata archaeon]
MADTRELGDGRLLLDLHFRDHEGLVASYALPSDDGWSLVETGPTTCHDALVRELGRNGIAPEEVKRVFVTHIHLDHAGGVGALATTLPHAVFYAHERGVRHLIDPSKLVASARRAWGPAADPLWGAIVPIPATRIRSLVGGESFPLQGGELQVLATPGHAQHHVSFLETRTRSILVGDSAGVFVEGSWRARPAIPPPDLDIAALFRSLERMIAAEPKRIWYSHFGPAPDAPAALRRYHATVQEWVGAAREAALTSPTVTSVAHALEQYEVGAAAAVGIAQPSEDRDRLVSGYELAAQGLLRYFELEAKKGSE